MPKEVRDTLDRTSTLAKDLAVQHPDLSHDYKVGDRNIHYVEVGSAPTAKPLILFIHGSPGDWRAWADCLRDPELQWKALMISVDPPGFGGSGKGIVVIRIPNQNHFLPWNQYELVKSSILEHLN